MEAALLWPWVFSDLLTSAVSCQQTADGEPLCCSPRVSLRHLFLRPVFVRPSSGLLSSSLSEASGIFWAFSAGGQWFLLAWKVLDSALERDYSCSGVERVQLPGGDVMSPAEEDVLRRHFCKSGLNTLVVPGWSKLCYTLHLKLFWHGDYLNWYFNWQSIIINKLLNDSQAHLKVLIIDICICIFQSTNRIIEAQGGWVLRPLREWGLVVRSCYQMTAVFFSSKSARPCYTICSSLQIISVQLHPGGPHCAVTGLVWQHRSVSIPSVRFRAFPLSLKSRKRGWEHSCLWVLMIHVQNLLQC